MNIEIKTIEELSSDEKLELERLKQSKELTELEESRKFFLDLRDNCWSCEC